LPRAINAEEEAPAVNVAGVDWGAAGVAEVSPLDWAVAGAATAVISDAKRPKRVHMPIWSSWGRRRIHEIYVPI
jgi:hypothetical protein